MKSSGDLRITENPPPNLIIAGGQSATLAVVASSPAAITYQWQRSAPGDEEFGDVAGAQGVTYVTPCTHCRRRWRTLSMCDHERRIPSDQRHIRVGDRRGHSDRDG
ncbi:MAG: hypothetical protein O3C21_05870 [Verrucomicrobia bacterium]|nr:hypothetical protein [Verrucomicrobiota bacterium]